MVQIDDVKQLSHSIVESHNARGFSLVKLSAEDPKVQGVLLNVSKDPLVIDGAQLKAKADVRRFLWDNRNGATVRRKDRTWIWTRYLKEENKSVMGFATLTSKDVAERLRKINPEYEWIEVSQ